MSSRKRWTAAFCIWVLVIWGHSLMPADLSSQESAGPAALLMPLLELFGVYDIHVASHIVRKTAHFCEYAVLMVLFANMVRSWRVRIDARLIALTCAVLLVVPSVDEFIQTFVPGRDGAPRDVVLDMCGGLFGLVLVWLHGRRKRNPEAS